MSEQTKLELGRKNVGPYRSPAPSREYLALDLFCGLGGWSDGLAVEGFKVKGVEILPRIAKLYKHPVIVSDVCDLDPAEFAGYDLIVGSPPCRDFITGSDSWWKIKKNPMRGVRLIRAFLKFVEIAKPTYWLMENIRGASKHINLKPRGVFKLSRTMFRCFWGNYPAFLIPLDYAKPLMGEIDNGSWSTSEKGQLRQWEKARIPLSISRALGRSVRVRCA